MADNFEPRSEDSENTLLPDAGNRPTLNSGRLVLRPFVTADSGRVQEICMDREIAATTRNIPHPYPQGAAQQWIESHPEMWTTGKAAIFAICLADGDCLVGAIGLEINQEDHNAELGYWLARDHWGRGICTEAAGAVVRFGFDQLGLQRVHSQCVTSNPASGRVLEKNGMIQEGLLRKHIRKWGVFQDVEVYGLLRSEFDERA